MTDKTKFVRDTLRDAIEEAVYDSAGTASIAATTYLDMAIPSEDCVFGVGDDDLPVAKAVVKVAFIHGDRTVESIVNRTLWSNGFVNDEIEFAGERRLPSRDGCAMAPEEINPDVMGAQVALQDAETLMRHYEAIQPVVAQIREHRRIMEKMSKSRGQPGVFFNDHMIWESADMLRRAGIDPESVIA